jgi:hypothetical protein
LETASPLMFIPLAVTISSILCALRVDGVWSHLSAVVIMLPLHCAALLLLLMLVLLLISRHADRASSLNAFYRNLDGPLRRACCAGLHGRRNLLSYFLSALCLLCLATAALFFQFKLIEVPFIVEWSWWLISAPLGGAFLCAPLSVCVGCGPSAADPHDEGFIVVDERRYETRSISVTSDSALDEQERREEESEQDIASSRRLACSLSFVLLAPLTSLVLLVMRLSFDATDGSAPVSLRIVFAPLWTCDILLFLSTLVTIGSRLHRRCVFPAEDRSENGSGCFESKLTVAVIAALNVLALAAFKALLVVRYDNIHTPFDPPSLSVVFAPLWFVCLCAVAAGTVATQRAMHVLDFRMPLP